MHCGRTKDEKDDVILLEGVCRLVKKMKTVKRIFQCAGVTGTGNMLSELWRLRESER